jgi:benzoyl-CoA reductase/2-hydroxyglutaryl-CoA dehydratase subunit BcrC/BadD/HgdB
VSEERAEKVKRLAHLHLGMESGEILQRIEQDLPGRPEAMKHFTDLFRRVFCEGISPHGEKPVVGTMCIQVPQELIYAAGAVPLRLCSGAAAFEQIGAELLPAKSCPLVKATLGKLQVLGAEPLRMVVVPTTCDQKKKAADMLSEMGFRVYALEVPPRKDSEEAGFYWHNSLKKFAAELQAVTGTRLTRARLREAIGKVSAARREYRRLLDLQAISPAGMYGTDVLLAVNGCAHEEIESWVEAMRTLNDELESRKREGVYVGNKRAPRVLFTGSPPIFPGLKLPLLVEQAGAVIVADEVCSSSRLLYDTVDPGEGSLYDMIPAIADRVLKPCTCPFFVSNPERKRRLMELTRRFAVEGVIYQAFSGCHLYEMEQRGIASALSKEGIPMLYIETDYSPRDTGQLLTRIEAFLDSIRSRRRKS